MKQDVLQLKKELKPICEALEKERLAYYGKAQQARGLLMVLGGCFIASLVLMFVMAQNFLYLFLGAASLSVILFAVVYNKLYLVPIKTYHSKFKSMFVHRAVQELRPDMEYRPGGYISQEVFEKSSLFDKANVSYTGEDYFEGVINNIPVQFSEVNAKHLLGKNTTILFQGLFFVADVPTSFGGKTILLPNLEDSLVGSKWNEKIEERYERLNAKDLKHLEEGADFGNYFEIYSTKPEETCQILCKEMLDSLLSLRKSFGTDLHVSFQDEEGYVYIAVSMPSILNPDIKTSVTEDHSIFYQMYAQLQTSFDVIKNLPLGFKNL